MQFIWCWDNWRWGKEIGYAKHGYEYFDGKAKYGYYTEYLALNLGPLQIRKWR